MRVALLDLRESPAGCNNKEVTGTYGSTMTGEGGISSIFAWAKRRSLKMPVVHMGYLNAIFREAGHDVLYCEDPPTESVDLVLMATSIVGADEEREAARAIRARFPDVHLGFFGAFAPVDAEAFLEAGDFVIRGEPEELCQRLAAGESLPTGVVASEEIRDLDILPDPDYRGFPVATYSYGPLLKGKPFLPVTTARGCPYDCFYCPYMVNQGKMYRRHSIERVIGQIRSMVERHGVRSILFRDIVFSMNKKRTRELCEALIEADLGIRWGAETRIDCLDDDLIRLMKRSGCEVLHFGVESVDNDILGEAGRRGMELDLQRHTVDLCESLGIKTVCFFILGFISDTEETMAKTIDYACTLNSTVAQFGIMTPYPGTRLYEQVEDRILTRDWKLYNTYNTGVRLDHLTSEQVLAAKRRAYRHYFMRPSWVFRRLPKLLLS